MGVLFELEATNLSRQLRLDDVDAGIEVGTFVFGGDDFAAWDFTGARKFVFVAVVAINFGDNDFSDDVLFVSAGEVAVELADFFSDVFAQVLFDFIVAAGDVDFLNHCL